MFSRGHKEQDSMNSLEIFGFACGAWVLMGAFIGAFRSAEGRQTIAGLVIVIAGCEMLTHAPLPLTGRIVRTTLANMPLVLILALSGSFLRPVLWLRKSKEQGSPVSSPFGLSSDEVESIVLAANLFARNSTGALIVLVEDAGVVNRHVTGAIELDARISSDLFASVFRPSAPLHDGAVILRNHRLWLACCYGPLSNSDQTDDFGSRHRAGLGFTEKGATLSVILSEERATISLAYRGRFVFDVSTEQLRAVLHKGWSSAKGPGMPSPTSVLPEIMIRSATSGDSM
jgi:DNA integrity scanning protein DisA with diadenylate cyclase activity